MLQTITTAMVKFPCSICQKAVTKRHKAISCDLCDKCVHVAGNNLDKKTHKNLQYSEIIWLCIPCLKKELRFDSISSQHLEKIFKDAPIVPVSLTKKQSFTENVDDFFQDQSKSLLNSQYYNISELNNMIVNHKEKILFISLKHALPTLLFPRPTISHKNSKTCTLCPLHLFNVGCKFSWSFLATTA